MIQQSKLSYSLREGVERCLHGDRDESVHKYEST